MKISPVRYVNKNINYNYNKNNTGKIIPPAFSSSTAFCGTQYPSGNYSDSEIKYAKKYLGQAKWEEDYRARRLDVLLKKFNDKFQECLDDENHPIKTYFCVAFWFITLPAGLIAGAAEESKINKVIDGEIRRINALMIDLNNIKLENIKKEQAKVQKQENSERQKSRIRATLTENLLHPLNSYKTDENVDVPTVVMISGKNATERNYALDWLVDMIDARVVNVDLPPTEDDALYRIETEIDYAKDYYNKNKIRSVIFMNNFDGILNSEKTSATIIGDMKRIMTKLHTSKAPLSIVFQTEDVEKINDAFIYNETRIPCKINLDEI